MNVQNLLLQLATLIGACTTIYIAFSKWFDKQVSIKLETIDTNQCRNYLVDFLSDIENGIQKNDIQIQRAYDVYDHYVDDLNGNSYVHDKFEKLKKEGKI